MKLSVRLLIFALSLFGSVFLAAQPIGSVLGEEDGLLHTQAVVLQELDSTSSYTYEPDQGSFAFPNVYRRRLFFDKKRFKELRELERGEDLEAYSQALSRYVAQFSSENFRDSLSVDLLWKLGRLCQLEQDTAGALFLYALADKHTRNWNAPRLAIDTLVAPTKSEWLPIDDYYIELRRRLNLIDPLVPPFDASPFVNMGRDINSNLADYAPFMHPSDSVLLFTSRRDESVIIDMFSNGNEQLYYSIKDFRTGKWQTAEAFENVINSEFNEGSACLSPEGKTLYFTRCNANDKDALGDCDLYAADYKAGKWVNVRNLGPAINSRDWDSQPTISADGRILFWSSNRPGGFGGMDLYYSTRDSSGNWRPSRNLGPVINTAMSEVSPFFHRINKTLYFGSTGQLYQNGGFDIFKSRWMGKQWEEPKNLGPFVNTLGDEYYFSIDSEGEHIYYSRSEEEGSVGDQNSLFMNQNFDLYSFPMPMEARPTATTKLRGVLLDSVTNYPLVGTVVIIDLDNQVEIAPKRINERGYFEFDLKNNNRYRIYVVGDNFLTVREDFVLRGDTSFNFITESIDQNKPLVFESLEFSTDSYDLRTDAKAKLDYLVRFLSRYPMYSLVVEGHTDSDGEARYNRELSELRARQIQAYILKEGKFDSERVSAEGYGETRPVVPNDTEANKRKNRRVEFRMVFDSTYAGRPVLPSIDELNFDEENLNEEDYFDADEFIREFDNWDENLEWNDESGTFESLDDWEEDFDELDSFEDELEREMDELLFKESGGGS